MSLTQATRRRAASRSGMLPIARCHLQKRDMLNRVTSASLSTYHGSIGERNLGFVHGGRRLVESIAGTGWVASGVAARRLGCRDWISSSRAVAGSYRNCSQRNRTPPVVADDSGAEERSQAHHSELSEGKESLIDELPRAAKRVVVGMSGGVDSSVAAMLLKQVGYDVIGVFMRNWDRNDEEGGEACTADVDLEDVMKVGKHLDIPIKTVDLSREYWNDVFAPALEQIAQGRTPNFDVWCNRFVKFEAFREYAFNTLGADLVATGHYARTRPGPSEDWDNPLLTLCEDRNKDQTYFLSAVPSSALSKIVFPLADLTKPEVRVLAARGKLPVSEKRESMGICFVGKRRSWRDFLAQYIELSPGEFVCVDTGKRLGKHEGLEAFTIGQKTKISGMTTKYYVVGFHRETSSVLVAEGFEHPSLFAKSLSIRVQDFIWASGSPPPELADALLGGWAGTKSRDGGPTKFQCMARIRHRAPFVRCVVEVVSPRAAGESGSLARLKQPAAGSSATSEGGKRGGAKSFLSLAWSRSYSEVVTKDDQDGDDGNDSHADSDPLQSEQEAKMEEEGRKHTSSLRRTNNSSPGGNGPAVAAAHGSSSSRHEDDKEEQLLRVMFLAQPLKSVTAGQVVALYKDSVCLGGGPILRPERHCSPVRFLPPPQEEEQEPRGKWSHRTSRANDAASRMSIPTERKQAHGGVAEIRKKRWRKIWASA